MRTEQYRATIRREQELRKLHSDADYESYLETIKKETLSRTQSDEERVYQFDIGRSRVTEFDPKQKKDTFYKTSGNRSLSRSGRPESSSFGFRPMSADWGKDVEKIEYHSPEFGGHSATAHFYDNSHIRLGH